MKPLVISVLVLSNILGLVIDITTTTTTTTTTTINSNTILISEYIPPKTGKPPDGDGSGSRT